MQLPTNEHKKPTDTHTKTQNQNQNLWHTYPNNNNNNVRTVSTQQTAKSKNNFRDK